jgi:hypothetical protein
MAQHDYVIDNQTAPNFRADLNSALQAIVSNNSGTSAPPVTYANMIWYDTTNDLLRMRNEADDAWITLGTLNQVANTFAAAAAVNAATLTGTATSDIQSSALASGTANSTTFLRGDRTWQTISVTPTTNDVLAATAGASVGAVGTYAMLSLQRGGTNDTINAAGTTASGSELRYANAGGGSSGTPAGTWRLMGIATSGITSPTSTSPLRVSLWLRIS